MIAEPNSWENRVCIDLHYEFGMIAEPNSWGNRVCIDLHHEFRVALGALARNIMKQAICSSVKTISSPPHRVSTQHSETDLALATKESVRRGAAGQAE